jgi:hypothetical protein
LRVRQLMWRSVLAAAAADLAAVAWHSLRWLRQLQRAA